VIGARLRTIPAKKGPERPTPVLGAAGTNVKSGNIYKHGRAPAPKLRQDTGYLCFQRLERTRDFFRRMHAAVIELQLERVNGWVVVDRHAILILTGESTLRRLRCRPRPGEPGRWR